MVGSARALTTICPIKGAEGCAAKATGAAARKSDATWRARRAREILFVCVMACSSC